jgi:hypothetical protein
MIDSIDRYYRYRTFDGSIKIKIVFKQEVGRFFVAMAKKTAKIRRIFFNSLIDWSILSIQCVPMVRWLLVREGFYDRLSILSIKNTKIFNRWSDNIDENETKSIDRYYRYRSIDPSPIVPIYGNLPLKFSISLDGFFKTLFSTFSQQCVKNNLLGKRNRNKKVRAT